MRVLAGPRVDLENDPVAAAVVRSLAGEEGPVVKLGEAGVRNLSRLLSAAEVSALRNAMAGDERPEAGSESDVIGYLCRGTGVPAAARGGVRVVVAVDDHVNLTWRSPLTGPNDDSVGPRFPSMTGIYRPGLVTERLGTVEGIIVVSGVAAGVRDDGTLNAFEKEMAGSLGVSAASSELVPVATVAAHMGLRVAAAVIIAGQ